MKFKATFGIIVFRTMHLMHCGRYRCAANQGCTESMLCVAEFYDQGLGVKKSSKAKANRMRDRFAAAVAKKENLLADDDDDDDDFIRTDYK